MLKEKLMFDFPTCKGRVTGEAYLACPDGHRTTLVCGMAETLNYSLLYASAERTARLEALLEFSNVCEPNTLRQLLDDYLNADVSRHKFLIAGVFVAALDEKC